MVIHPDKVELVWEYRTLSGLKNLNHLYSCLRDGSWCPREESHCCVDCQYRYGYLRFIKRSDRSIYESSFTKDYGFLGKDGCKLPRKLRSVTCLTHLCRTSKLELSDDQFAALVALRDIMLDLEGRIAAMEVRGE